VRARWRLDFVHTLDGVGNMTDDGENYEYVFVYRSQFPGIAPCEYTAAFSAPHPPMTGEGGCGAENARMVSHRRRRELRTWDDVPS